jgi:VWFA-related protein
MRSLRLPSLTLLALALPLSSTPSPAQSPNSDSPPHGKTVLHVTTNLTLVDVVITYQGNAVQGLDRKRFHIFEDGHEQHITSFDEHDQNKPHPTLVAVKTSPPLPPHTYSNLPSYPESTALNVILLDELNTPFESQDYLHRQLLDYLRVIPPGTSLAIFSLNSRLRLLHGFTTDPTQLIAALQTPAKADPSVESDHHTVDTMGSSKGGHGAAFAAATLGQFAGELTSDQTDKRAEITLQATLQLARYLAAIPGRKNLVWFSGAFPIASDPGAMLSAARVAVYPVDARGIVVQPRTDASANELNAYSKVGALNDQFLQETGDQHNAMQQIADQTGGHAFVDTNGFKQAIASAVDNGSTFYTIGYVPPASALTGRFRSITVRMDNAPGYNLAYRHTFYAALPTPESDTPATPPDHTSAATLLGAPSATQILFEARILPASDSAFANAKLPDGLAGDMAATLKPPVQRTIVDLMVSPHNLIFTQAPDGVHHARLQFNIAAYDDDGNRINFLNRITNLNMQSAQFAWSMAQGIPVRLALDLPPGHITLRLAVADLTSERTGSLEVPLAIAAPQPSRLNDVHAHSAPPAR